MSIDINIDSHDISDWDERLEDAFNIRNEWGSEAVDDEFTIITGKFFLVSFFNEYLTKHFLVLPEHLSIHFFVWILCHF